MATSTVPQPAARALGFLSHPLHGLSVMLAGWRESHRRRVDAVLLMRLEPHMLKDIGVILAEQRGSASAMLKWHPAVLATTLERDPQRMEDRQG